ncbi:hypothetical protein JK232_11655 [Nissabacter archeti]|uniref:Uncharacterized protein n=1 Tax=Nissabacter archeti TaxID=1917880 RepID=A0ABS5JHT4_9GAMM|nr:hypothetical protein [Nissabacter archeti]MBS0969546.1 hypothetical protein [Nissabacter archeti]
MLFITPCFADELCDPDDYSCYNISLGKVRNLSASESNDGYSYIYLNDKIIYKAKVDLITPDPGAYYLDKKNKKRDKIIFYYYARGNCTQGIDDYKCHANIMIDLTKRKPIVSNIFSPPVDGSHVSWVSWGEKNSIIAFDDDSRFKYENGKVEMTYGGYVEEQEKMKAD